jgi:hypothetical protein
MSFYNTWAKLAVSLFGQCYPLIRPWGLKLAMLCSTRGSNQTRAWSKICFSSTKTSKITVSPRNLWHLKIYRKVILTLSLSDLPFYIKSISLKITIAMALARTRISVSGKQIINSQGHSEYLQLIIRTTMITLIIICLQHLSLIKGLLKVLESHSISQSISLW